MSAITDPALLADAVTQIAGEIAERRLPAQS